jgi:plastocyanin
MNKWIIVLFIAVACAVLGFKASSNMAGTQCEPNKPKSIAVAVNVLLADTNTPVEPAADMKVVMTNSMKFDPDRAVIEAGQTVLWNNTSDLAHTVTADPAKAKNKEDCNLPAGANPFDSGIIRPGQTYFQTFTVPGTYKYFCIPHETMGMIGQIIVNPSTK